MAFFNTDQEVNEQLDNVGRLVLRAASQTEAETEAAALTPFLFARVRSAIAEEQKRGDQTGGWLSLLFVARHAVPAMVLIAVLTAILTVFSAQFGAPNMPVRLDDEALSDTRDPGVEQTVLANRNGLSRDEVFGIVLDRNDAEQH